MKIDLTGQRFGRLIVLEDTGKRSSNRQVIWKCLCDCGNNISVISQNLKSGGTRSCGCLHQSHGHTSNGNISSTYYSWRGMKNRCYNENCPDYENYGGRGITVCDRWLNSFDNFLEDMGERPEGMTLDRINPNGNYEPSNCRYATYKIQNNNTRKHYANKYSIKESKSKKITTMDVLKNLRAYINALG